MTIETIVASVVSIIGTLAFPKLWGLLRFNSKSREAISIKKLELEEKQIIATKQYYEAIFQELKEKHEMVLEELRGTRQELKEAQIDLIRTNAKMEKAISYMEQMNTIIQHTIKEDHIKHMIQELNKNHKF